MSVERKRCCDISCACFAAAFFTLHVCATLETASVSIVNLASGAVSYPTYQYR